MSLVPLASFLDFTRNDRQLISSTNLPPFNKEKLFWLVNAMAIVHIAMFDALDAVVGGYTSYTGTQVAHGPVSVDAAISQAARDTLAAVFPSQRATFDAYLAEDLAGVRNPQQKANGIDLGH